MDDESGESMEPNRLRNVQHRQQSAASIYVHYTRGAFSAIEERLIV